MTSAIQRRKEKNEERKWQLVWQTALYDASMQNGDLRLSWTTSPAIHPMLYTFHETFGIKLRSLRLIGIGLSSLPDDFFPALRLLEVLAIENNPLPSLPDNIDCMLSLRELSLANNKLVSLPRRIGYLCSLTKLALNNNCLEALPPSIGALASIERLDLECNALSLLPESLDQMTLCRSVIVSQNRLQRLPRCLGRMPSLTLLSATSNELQYLPLDLCTHTSLSVLRLSRNKLSALPERVGELVQLVELAIDHNMLTSLPISLHRLTQLRILRIDGNAILDPPSEVLARGAKAVVQHFRAHFLDDKEARMRHIILATQSALRDIHDFGFHDPAFFEMDVVLSGEKYFGLQPRHLFDDLLPKLRRMAQQREQIASLPFTEEEVMWAWSHYTDANGPVLRRDKVCFRRCRCSPPCLPPRPGYLCQRDAYCFKQVICRLRDKQERLWKVYKESSEQDAVRRAEAEARAYLSGREGHRWLQNAAYEQAEEQLLDGGVSRVVQNRIDRAEARKRRIVHAFQKRQVRLAAVRDRKASALQAELDKLKAVRGNAGEGYLRAVLDQRIQAVVLQLSSIPEARQLQELEKKCEDAVQAIEDALYRTSSSSSENEDSTSAEEELEQQEEEEEEQQQKERAAALKEAKEAESLSEDLQRLWMRTKGLFQPIQARMARRTRRWTRRAQRYARDVVEVQTIRWKRTLDRLRGNLDELQRELAHELERQYIAHEITRAREKVRREFHVLEEVRQSLQGTSLLQCFLSWKRWVWAKRQRLRRDARRQYRLATRGFLAAVESVRSAQAQVDMWRKQVDVFSDRPFYVHSVTGAVTWETPGLQHYLPPNFSIPPPLPVSEYYRVDPNDPLRCSSSSSDSSTESLTAWQERYGRNRDGLRMKMEQEEQQIKERKAEESQLHNGSMGEEGQIQQFDPEEQDKKLREEKLILPPIRGVPPSTPATPAQALEDPREKYSQSFWEAVAWAKEVQHSDFYHKLVEKIGGGFVPTAYSDTHTTMHPTTANISHDIASEEIETFNGEEIVLGGLDGYEEASSNREAEVEQVRSRAFEEQEKAYASIRRIRNRPHEARRQLYMQQAVRKPRSHMQAMAQQNLPSVLNAVPLEQPGMTHRNEEMMDTKKKGKTPIIADPLNPTEEELLRLAGGDVDMIHTGKPGFDLRTILAQRAVHIKQQLRAKALEDKPQLRSKYGQSFFQREIMPFFVHRVESDSSDEEEPQPKGKKGKKLK